MTSFSRPSTQKNSLLLLFAALLLILSCAPFANGAGPLSGTTVTSTLPPKMTSTPTSTAAAIAPTMTPNITPTFTYSSVWRFSRIAFASNRSGTFQIFLMNPDGSKVTQLTQASGDNTSPTWSPDAKQIAFVSTRDGNPQIYSMNPDGTKQTNISGGLANDTLPIWLPDKRIAFVSDRKGRDRIFAMNADGSNVVAFANSSIDSTSKMFCLTVIADNLMSFTTDQSGVRSVQALDLQSGNVARPIVLNSPSDRSCPLIPALVTDPWAVYVSNRDGQDEIYKYDTNTKSEVQLTFQSVSSLGPSRSSSEDAIAFYSKRTGNWDIYILGLNAKNQWNITNNPADDIQPAWEPY